MSKQREFFLETKEGAVFQVNSFDGIHDWTYLLYTFADMNSPNDYSVRTLHPWSPHAGSGGTTIGFGRDARGYAQLVKAEFGYDKATEKSFETRTIFSWDDKDRNWKAGRPVVAMGK